MKIITAVVNNTDFIEIQYFTLKKYFQGNYEFIVFNDAKDFPDYSNGNDITIKDKIENLCNILNIKCINIPNSHHINHNTHRCTDSMNYILNYQKENPDIYLLLDSDMFLIDYFDINKYSGFDCAIVLQRTNNLKTNYFWNGIYYFDFTKLKDIEMLNWSEGNGDVGVMMQSWFEKQMGEHYIPTCEELRWTNEIFHTDKIYFIRHLWSCSWDSNDLPENIKKREKLVEYFKNDDRNQNNKFFCEIYDNVFLHYRAGGNWNMEGFDYHKKKSEVLKYIIFENMVEN